jgi:hypothetical protein
MAQETFAPPVAPQSRGPFLALRGGFTFGAAQVPFWTITLTAEDAVNYIHLPSDIPISDERPIDINELFQRELDEVRVRGDLSTYIKTTDEPRFFNSLTVALLPMSRTASSGHLSLADVYDPSDSHALPTVRGYEMRDVGQIAVYDHQADPGHGFISWDPVSTLPVVLDGQHRLATLKEALSGPAFPGKQDLAASRVSILLLVLDSRAGFSGGPGESVLSACRSVFVDLNKHAKGVSKARQYLLDDRDVTASSLRAVLSDSVDANPTESIRNRALASLRLPLAVVDWRSDSAKFDGDSPYVTTILSLHGVVETMVAAKMPDPDDYEDMRAYLQRISARLLPRERVSEVADRLDASLSSAESRERPYSIPMDMVAELASGFRSKYGPRIVRPLLEIRAYEELISTLEQRDWLSTRLEPWFSLDNIGAERLIERLDLPDPGPAIHQISASLKQGNLAFQVVFQRALLLSLHSLLAFPRESWSEGFGMSGDALEEAVIDEYIHRVNDRLDLALRNGAHADSPFLGAGVRADGTIDFRKTRVSGIVAFIIFCVFAPREPDTDKLASWLAAHWTRTAGSLGPMQQLLASHGTAWKRGLADVLRSRGEEESEANLLALATDRMLKVLK